MCIKIHTGTCANVNCVFYVIKNTELSCYNEVNKYEVDKYKQNKT